MKKDACILTVCESGEDRSVCFATILKHDKHYTNVLNCGIEKTTPQTFAMLARWADRIFVTADRTVWRRIPVSFRRKATFVDIGKDVWYSPVAPELKKICREKIEELGL